ncbi:MAG: hypothetical protein Sw1PiTSA_11160 [Shewanella algae]|nr:hypothetical protein TUM17382_01360 [Shewanella algae]
MKGYLFEVARILIKPGKYCQSPGSFIASSFKQHGWKRNAPIPLGAAAGSGAGGIYTTTFGRWHSG